MAQQFQTKKSLGQHFLTTPTVPKWMCDAAQVQEGDLVLEIGPGTGVLTKELLARGARVIALEADLRAIAVLEEAYREEIEQGTLIIYHTDVRTFTPQSLEELSPGNYKVVANIPYYLSGMLFRTFLESHVQPSCLVYLVQKEVAKRICVSQARGEKESILSLSVQVFGEPKYIKTVSKGHFSPAPKVDSGIILVQGINRLHFEHMSPEHFFSVLHLGFGQKRKQLLGNLTAHYTKEDLVHIFSTLKIPEKIRAEDVPLATWLLLCRALSNQSTR
jgi:16S rRNA (adenine1518-N6/adenine1519-N6)-dimethyltransferase